MAETMVSVQIDAAAAARVDEFGMRKELEQMLAYAHQMRGLRGIEVTLEDDPATVGHGPEVVIWVCRDVPPEGPRADRVDQELTEWRIQTFPPNVCFHIGMVPVYGGPNER